MFSLNFIWINHAKATLPSKGSIEDWKIEPALLANLSDITSNLPDVPINIWVDIYGIGNHPSGIIADMQAERPEPNVSLRALEEIPAYRTEPLFGRIPSDYEEELDQDNLIWRQADTARLIVLSHLLKQGDDAAIYADMDLILTDKNQGFIKAKRILEEQGCVVGFAPYPSRSDYEVENQFMGFGHHQQDFLDNYLIPETLRRIEGGEENGFECFWESFQEPVLVEYDLQQEQIGLVIDSLDTLRAQKLYEETMAGKLARISPVGKGMRNG